MDAARTALSWGIRAVAAIAPPVGARLALRAFMHVGAAARVHPDDAPTMDLSSRSTVRVAGLDGSGVDVVVHEWGRGDRTVVLAHGWRGRASQFAPLVRELVSEGYRVIAFDAPGHGDSAGRRPYLIDWTDAVKMLREPGVPFHAIVGHSFGGLAALVAVADGVATERVVTVAAPVDADTLLGQFRAAVGFGPRLAAALRRRFAAVYFPGDADPFPAVSAVERPLPDGVRLLVVHDRRDRQVPYEEATRILGANPGGTLLTTRGLGHARILASDAFLDGVLDALAEPIDVPAVTQNSRPESDTPAAAPTARRPREVVTT